MDRSRRRANRLTMRTKSDGAPMAGREGLATDNRLLGSMTEGDLALLAPRLKRVPFVNGDVIAKAGDVIDTICFPEGAIAALLDRMDDRQYAVGLVGNEGFLGWPILMGQDRWCHDVVMRAEHGTALTMSAQDLIAVADQSATLRERLLRFAGVFMTQMAGTVVSTLAHPIERRMARWILLYHDRVREDEICMTHEEFRLMLGVRRSSVTEALHRLEEEQAVRSLRGRVIVRDRTKLLALAGDTYGPPEREYRRLIAGE